VQAAALMCSGSEMCKAISQGLPAAGLSATGRLERIPISCSGIRENSGRRPAGTLTRFCYENAKLALRPRACAAADHSTMHARFWPVIVGGRAGIRSVSLLLNKCYRSRPRARSLTTGRADRAAKSNYQLVMVAVTYVRPDRLGLARRPDYAGAL